MIHRSWLFIPGGSAKMLGKAGSLGADAVVLDLEDAVVEARKAEARQLVHDCLQSGERNKTSFWVRINALNTPHASEDLKAIMPGRPAGIFLPKADSATYGETLANLLDELETANDLKPRSTRILLVAIESARAMLNIHSYAKGVHPRVQALTWGSEDLSASLGALSNRDDNDDLTHPYQLARSLTLTAAATVNVQAVDMPTLDIHNEEQLRQDCAIARRDGFLGKIAIHPKQVPIINECFMPSQAEINHAREVVQAFADNPDTGTISLNGKMMDLPHLHQAKRTLTIAEQYES